MKYLQNGSFQSNQFMRLTLGLTILFLIGFVVTNFALFFSKMDLTPSSVISYYNGSEEEFRPARTFQSMLEISHGHLPMMALVLLLLTHLVIFAPFSKTGKITFILVAFLSGLFNESSSWLVRFVHPEFAWLKVFSFVTLQASLMFLLGAVGVFLVKVRSNGSSDPPNGMQAEDVRHDREPSRRSRPRGKSKVTQQRV